MRPWTSPEGIAFEDVQTGDGRIYIGGALYWDPMPNGWPHRADIEDDGWHAGAVLIGAATTMERRPDGSIGAEGWMDDETEWGAIVSRMHDQGAPLGVSIDMDDVAVQFVDTEVQELGDGDDELAGVMFSAGGLTASAIFTPDRALHSLVVPGLRGVLAAAGLTNVLAAAGDGDPDDGVVLFEDAMDSMLMRCTRARIRGMTEVQIPAFARAAIVYGPAGSVPVDDTADTPTDEEADDGAAAATIGRIVEPPPVAASSDCGCGGTCGGNDCGGQGLAAAAAATTVPVQPPRRFLAPLDFGDGDVTQVEDPTTGRTLRGVPMHYLGDGEVLGHIGMWGQCHTGSPAGQCVQTPRSASGYTWFRHGHLLLDDGDLVPVGNLTLGGGHADITLSYRAALNHYDDVATQAAQLVAGEDRYGVWVHGSLHPQVGDNEIAMRSLRAASPSGDWRWIGGALELIIAHCVNGPGLPVPRPAAQVAAGGVVTALVAAGAREVRLLAEAAARPGDHEAIAETVEAAVAAGIQAGVAAVEAAARRVRTAGVRRELSASARERIIADLEPVS